MASKIKLSNANGKIVMIENNDSNMSDITLNGASITKKVDTLANMRAMNELPETVWCSGYHSKNDGAFGSNIFEWDSTSTEDDNGGTIIKLDSVATGRYKLRYSGSVNVKWFGLTGSNDGSDTIRLQNWLDSGNNLVGCDKTIYVTSSISKDISNGFKLVANGLKIKTLNATVSNTNILGINIISNIDKVSITGLDIDANNAFAGGIIVSTNSSTNFVDTIELKYNKVINIRSDSTTISAKAIESNAQASIVDISKNIVDEVSRLQKNEGIIASIGLSIKSSEGTILVEGNRISNIKSIGAGLHDADGIQISGRNYDENPEINQDINIAIFGNKIFQCQGRCIKLQASGAKIFSNSFENKDIALKDNYQFIDAQYGGVDIFDNTFRLDGTTNYLGEAHNQHDSIITFSLGRSFGMKEVVVNIHNNTIYLEVDAWYMFVGGSIGATRSLSYNVENNKIVHTSSDYVALNFFSRLIFSDDFAKVYWNVTDNTFPLMHGGTMLYFRNTATNIASDTIGDTIKDRTELMFRNNKCTTQLYNTINVAQTYILRDLYSGVMYLQNFVISGNTGFTRDDISLKGCELRKLPVGNSFRFIGDGLGGGFTDAKLGYELNVQVDINDKEIRVTKDDGTSFYIQSNTSTTAYEYIGTPV